MQHHSQPGGTSHPPCYRSSLESGQGGCHRCPLRLHRFKYKGQTNEFRVGECSVLMIEDLNLAKRQILLRAEVTKGRKDRTVYFSQKTESILRRWLQYKDRYVESPFVFPAKYSGRNIQVSNFETNFKGYLRRAGLNDSLSPHFLRNNFAKRCLMNGMDIYTLSKILGHSSVTVTEQAYYPSMMFFYSPAWSVSTAYSFRIWCIFW